jgi:hypothetical protein
MPIFVNIADLKNPSDPQGRSYREVNLAKTHGIPVGTLVELRQGARLFVVHHHRDCDGTPLYAMSHDRDDTVKHDERFHNSNWVHGYPEGSLKVVNPQPEPLSSDFD